jgi:hypothetical protein
MIELDLCAYKKIVANRQQAKITNAIKRLSYFERLEYDWHRIKSFKCPEQAMKHRYNFSDYEVMRLEKEINSFAE